MKRLYGLGEPDYPDPSSELPASPSNASASGVHSDATMRLPDSYTEARHTPAPVPAVAVAADSVTPDFDRALIELQTSMAIREEAQSPEPFVDRQQDPLALSMSAESMGGSGGLIAWSKNLRPEDLSPDVTLSNFLRPHDLFV